MRTDGNELKKLTEIQQMALGFNQRLTGEFGETYFRVGGNLFLGRFYARSDRIYFGLNPGSVGENCEFVARLEDDNGFNQPFRNPEKFNREFRFGGNWQRFLEENEELNEWFNNKVTSTFLVPWRTANVRPELYRLNSNTKGRVFEYSANLVKKMLEHHNAKVLIICGKAGLHLLNEFLKPGWDYREIEAAWKRQKWQKRCIQTENSIVVLQIPHFSRGIRRVDRAPFSTWLRRELKPFGCR
jgi:hypothetical protein